MRPTHHEDIRLAPERVDQLLAKVRSKQLATAVEGRVLDSARYARRAERIRRKSQRQPLAA